MSSHAAVLLLSGDADSAEMYAVGLSLAGFRPVVVADASSVRSRIAALPDAVVIDLTPGWQTGWEALRALRGMADTRDTPVVLLCGDDEEVIRSRAEGLGCSALLAKPCLPDALAGAVHAALQTRTATSAADAGNSFLDR
jgi:DNA-binding response OmpR family regulator